MVASLGEERAYGDLTRLDSLGGTDMDYDYDEPMCISAELLAEQAPTVNAADFPIHLPRRAFAG